MTIATNADLKTALAAASMRSDLDLFMQDFVNRAHAVLARNAIMYAPVTISAAGITLPTDFGQVHQLWIMRAPAVLLTQVSADQLALLTDPDVPQWFNIVASQVGPAPDQTYEGRLLYKIDPTFPAADGDTNSILQAYPFAYVYGALAEIARWIFDEDLEDRRETAFQAEIGNINQAESAKALAGAALQMTASSTVA